MGMLHFRPQRYNKYIFHAKKNWIIIMRISVNNVKTDIKFIGLSTYSPQS